MLWLTSPVANNKIVEDEQLQHCQRKFKEENPEYQVSLDSQTLR